jgi:hypothetical protein
MKTTVDIPDDLLSRAKAVALRHDMTLKELTYQGLCLAIERLEQKKSVEIVPHVVTGRSLARDPSWEHFRQILYGEEGGRLR